jgi:protein tyrosine phosphatase (PTP) superfamily phosphohydrolase (DUF442 family)
MGIQYFLIFAVVIVAFIAFIAFIAYKALLFYAARSINQVDANIYIGGHLAARNFKTIKKHGITRIVKLLDDDDNYRHPGVLYAVFSSLDDPCYDISADAFSALQFINEGIENGDKILVHCRSGISRSSTVVLLYLMMSRGYTLKDALTILRNARPFIRPNFGFMQYLQSVDSVILRTCA